MGRRSTGDSNLCLSRHLTQDLKEYMFWAVCLGVTAEGRRTEKAQEFLETSTSLGQTKTMRLSVHLCLQREDTAPGRQRRT